MSGLWHRELAGFSLLATGMTESMSSAAQEEDQAQGWGSRRLVGPE